MFGSECLVGSKEIKTPYRNLGRHIHRKEKEKKKGKAKKVIGVLVVGKVVAICSHHIGDTPSLRFFFRFIYGVYVLNILLET